MPLPPPTAATDAAFLLPHLTPTTTLLDLGCGRGDLTASLSKHTPHGLILAVDNSPRALAAALETLTPCCTPTRPHRTTREPRTGNTTITCGTLDPATGSPLHGPVRLIQADARFSLPCPDNSVDVVFASQVLGHWDPDAHVVPLLRDARRVLKPGSGVLATRDAMDQVFHPKACALDRLWVASEQRANAHLGIVDAAPLMPRLVVRAGFAESSVRMGVGTCVVVGREVRRELAERAMGQLGCGGRLWRKWTAAGIVAPVVAGCVTGFEAWMRCEEGWMVTLQMEVLAWK